MTFANLSKWDFAVEFSLYEAASLIVGIDPAEIFNRTGPSLDNSHIYDFHEDPELKPVVDRMKFDYLSGVELYSALREGAWRHADPAPRAESVLRSREMESVPLRLNIDCLPLDQADQEVLDHWYSSDEVAIYETAKFARSELCRWLGVIGLKSAYQFESAAALQSGRPNDAIRSPWGKHHTVLLGHLQAAAARYWTNYDPEDQTTAPTNSAVSNWLQTERQVSKTMADAIASILRADGLPTGPRK